MANGRPCLARLVPLDAPGALVTSGRVARGPFHRSPAVGKVADSPFRPRARAPDRRPGGPRPLSLRPGPRVPDCRPGGPQSLNLGAGHRCLTGGNEPLFCSPTKEPLCCLTTRETKTRQGQSQCNDRRSGHCRLPLPVSGVCRMKPRPLGLSLRRPGYACPALRRQSPALVRSTLAGVRENLSQIPLTRIAPPCFRADLTAEGLAPSSWPGSWGCSGQGNTPFGSLAARSAGDP